MATNVLARFQKFFAGDRLLVVTILSIAGTGCTGETASGGVVKLKGNSVAVGAKAYAKGGIIIGEAPNLTHYDIEV